jgi:hypothetical protein
MTNHQEKYFRVIHREEIDKLAEKMAIACAAQTVMNRSPEEVATWAYRCASEFVDFRLRRNELVDVAKRDMRAELRNGMRMLAAQTIDVTASRTPQLTPNRQHTRTRATVNTLRVERLSLIAARLREHQPGRQVTVSGNLVSIDMRISGNRHHR